MKYAFFPAPTQVIFIGYNVKMLTRKTFDDEMD